MNAAIVIGCGVRKKCLAMMRSIKSSKNQRRTGARDEAQLLMGAMGGLAHPPIRRSAMRGTQDESEYKLFIILNLRYVKELDNVTLMPYYKARGNVQRCRWAAISYRGGSSR
jgi:hypothetical protein